MKYFINNFFNKVFLVVGLIVLPATQIISAKTFDVEIGTGLLSFKYTEYNDNNVFLDAETGLIPGLILKLKSDNQTSYTEWLSSVYYNQINYDGQTQAGTPLQTISDALIFDSHVKWGKKFSALFGRDESIYTGLGYRYWLRNIRPGYDNSGNAVAGILEEYHWFYGLVGYATHFKASEKVNVGLDFRLTRMFSAKMDINFLGFKSYDNTAVDLGNKTGARFAVPIEIKLAHNSFFITPYYEVIDIGKSNSVRIFVGGVGTTTSVLEPRSETRNLGVEFTWVW